MKEKMTKPAKTLVPLFTKQTVIACLKNTCKYVHWVELKLTCKRCYDIYYNFPTPPKLPVPIHTKRRPALPHPPKLCCPKVEKSPALSRTPILDLRPATSVLEPTNRIASDKETKPSNIRLFPSTLLLWICKDNKWSMLWKGKARDRDANFRASRGRRKGRESDDWIK